MKTIAKTARPARKKTTPAATSKTRRTKEAGERVTAAAKPRAKKSPPVRKVRAVVKPARTTEPASKKKAVAAKSPAKTKAVVPQRTREVGTVRTAKVARATKALAKKVVLTKAKATSKATKTTPAAKKVAATATVREAAVPSRRRRKPAVALDTPLALEVTEVPAAGEVPAAPEVSLLPAAEVVTPSIDLPETAADEQGTVPGNHPKETVPVASENLLGGGPTGPLAFDFAEPDDGNGAGWEDGAVPDISVADVLADAGLDEDDLDEADDEEEGEDLRGDDAGHDADDEPEEEHDDTPLGESVPTDASGGLDPAVAAAARRLGIQRLYPEQERGIRDGLAGRDVLIVMPTGFGKSACYQVPSMVLPRPVVLISPLLALLKDQHEKLLRFHVPCVRLDGTVRGKARTEALERIAAGGSLLVMTTPETLASEEMSKVLARSGISLAAIDEAHCISEWGFDFRPAYLRLGETLRKLGRPPLLALTATATEKVRTDIIRYLGMRSPTVVASSPHRSNLAFEVLECREAARLRALARLAQRLRRPGIIYCSTTREVDIVYTILVKLGIPAHRYHGKMAAGDRVREQEMYMKPGRRTVMVATSAFGLGIDKPDIRYVVHQQSPASLEQYVQEAGRAGRDGARANCILLHDPADRAVHEALLSRSRLRPDQLYKLGSALAAWAGEGRTPTIDALALSADLGERPTHALLATLEEAGLVKISEELTVRATVAPGEVEEKSRSLAGQFANMRTQDSRRLDSVADYAQDKGCRAIYLRSYFGEENGTSCGLCDVCRGRPERPSNFWAPVATPARGRKRRGRRGQAQQRPHPQRHPAPQLGQPGQPGQPEGGRRRRRRRRGRRGGGPGPQGVPMQDGAQRGMLPQGASTPSMGQPHMPHPNGGPQEGQQPSRSSRRRRRRGRRRRGGQPNPGMPPTSSGEG